ncbi:MAG TPA: DUF1453 domain-containing protein [Verrucomicrobiae bacterium]
MAAPTLPILIGGGYAAWAVYRRVRRNIGKQKLRPVPIIIRLCIFALLIVGIFLVGVILNNTAILLTFGGGLLSGAGLGLIGLHLTRFETTDEGHYYTPNTYIGAALTLLLAGRMAYRFMMMNNIANATAANSPPPMQSPLTFFIIGLTVGYYMVYYIGLFVHTHDRKPDGSGVQNY